MSKILHIAPRIIAPKELERIITEKNEELITFSDPLIFGPVLPEGQYNVKQRRTFWNRMYSKLELKYRITPTIGNREKDKYNRVRDFLNDGGRMTIWYWNNPDNLFWICFLTNYIGNHFSEDQIRLARYTNRFRLVKPIRIAQEDEIRYFADCWKELTCGNQFNPFNGVKNYPSQQIKLIYETLRDLTPRTGQLADIDKKLLSFIPDDSVIQSSEIIGNFLRAVVIYGDWFLFYRLIVLETMGVIYPVVDGRYNKKEYRRTPLYKDLLNRFADSKMWDNYRRTFI